MSTQALPLIKNYIDRELLAQIASTCDLWVGVSATRITLLVADTNNQKVAGLTILDINDSSFFEKGLFEMRAWLEGVELYNNEYNNTHIVFETPQYSIIPEALFVADKADLLLQSQHQIPKFSVVKNNRVDAQQWVNVYAVPDIFCSTIKVLFPQADIHHYAEFMIQANINSSTKQQHTFFVNVHAQYIDMMHVHQQELKFINTFLFEADTDIIYFVLSVAEQQKISVDKIELILTGEVNANGTLLQLMRKYIPDVVLYKREDEYTYPASFREFQDQQNYITIAPLLCE